MGPEHWQELEGSACAGNNQSPINIIRTDTRPDVSANLPLALHYPATTQIYSVVNNGHSIQYNFEQGDEIEFRGARYGLKQVHFHEPSEHTLNGVRYPIEMHLVHFNASLNRYTVLAVLGYEGAPSAGYQFLEKYLPLAEGEMRSIGEPFNLSQVLPANLNPPISLQRLPNDAAVYRKR
jgi:carbonic anhydrase